MSFVDPAEIRVTVKNPKKNMNNKLKTTILEPGSTTPPQSPTRISTSRGRCGPRDRKNPFSHVSISDINFSNISIIERSSTYNSSLPNFMLDQMELAPMVKDCTKKPMDDANTEEEEDEENRNEVDGPTIDFEEMGEIEKLIDLGYIDAGREWISRNNGK